MHIFTPITQTHTPTKRYIHTNTDVHRHINTHKSFFGQIISINNFNQKNFLKIIIEKKKSTEKKNYRQKILNQNIFELKKLSENTLEFFFQEKIFDQKIVIQKHFLTIKIFDQKILTENIFST